VRFREASIRFGSEVSKRVPTRPEWASRNEVYRGRKVQHSGGSRTMMNRWTPARLAQAANTRIRRHRQRRRKASRHPAAFQLSRSARCLGTCRLTPGSTAGCRRFEGHFIPPGPLHPEVRCRLCKQPSTSRDSSHTTWPSLLASADSARAIMLLNTSAPGALSSRKSACSVPVSRLK
jgi:hypothetical protein